MRPMPSPRGTNIAQMFLPDRGPLAAYDDANGFLSDDEVEKVIAFLKGKLSEEDLAKAREILVGKSAMSMDSRSISRQVADVIAATNEAREASFAARFPDAARISVVGYGGEQRYERRR